MTCTTCGMDQATGRDDHPCDRDARPTTSPRPNRPSWGWRALTLGLLGVAVAYLGIAVLNIVVEVQDYRFVTRFAADPASVSGSEIDVRMERTESVYAIVLFLFLAHLAAYVVWFKVTRKTVERHGGDPRATLTHWTFTAWRILVVGLFLLVILMRYDGAADTFDVNQVIDEVLDFQRFAVFTAVMRLPLVGLLVAGVCIVARRVYELAASRPLPSAPYSAPTGEPRALPRTAVQDGPGKDAFWTEVGQAVARSAGPLPLLEVWAAAPSARRWHLLHGEPDIAATRTRLSPWSGITVYGEPPRTPDEAVLGELAERARRLRDDPAAGGAIGLIEEVGGRLRFAQLTSDAVLQSWLGQARSAPLAGVYPVLAAADPAALTSG
jgi:hypothetical protein